MPALSRANRRRQGGHCPMGQPTPPRLSAGQVQIHVLEPTGRLTQAPAQDLVRTIREGIEGSSMPSFRLLPDKDIEALASYVAHLSLRGQVEYQVIKTALSPEGLDQSVDATVAEFLTNAVRDSPPLHQPKTLSQPPPYS